MILLQLTIHNANYMQMSDLWLGLNWKKVHSCLAPALCPSPYALKMPLLLPLPSSQGCSSPPFRSCQICGLLWQLQSWARPNAPTQTTVTPSRAAWASRHPGPPLGAVGETQACPSSGVLPCAPAAVCSHFPGELPHCLETASLVNNWRWDLPKDLGHLRLLAAAWLYISSQHHIARPQCSLFPASKLY